MRPQALDLVSRDGKHVVPSRWSSDIASLIKLAAQDNDVTRIFVNPAIKQQLCLDAGNDRDWLRKVRPRVPASRAYARAFTLPCRQHGVRRSAFTPPGDGCGAELQSWFEPPKHGTTKPEEDTAAAAAFLPGATG